MILTQRMKNMMWQGLLVLLFGSGFWLLNRLPGWLVERAVQQQLALLPPAPTPGAFANQSSVSERAATEMVRIPSSARPSREYLYDALKVVKDPEIDINVVDLGLIREVSIDAEGVTITMKVTKRFCPYQSSLVNGVKAAAQKAAPNQIIQVNVDYAATWSINDLTAEGKSRWKQIFGGAPP